ncbi:hypothetical protein C4J97_3342 [Pseudomonas orientalis]|nr:hypothetical protein C4J97_3342 [Pseudomonas orientalis]
MLLKSATCQVRQNGIRLRHFGETRFLYLKINYLSKQKGQ